ncbi:MAG: hypothetical protein II857_12735 [Selenomonadaceae bacterium]|nr:hypothetical protein [Selenomonadaceae bacterium]
MTIEPKELEERFWRAMSIWYTELSYATRHNADGSKSETSILLDDARDVFLKMHEVWRASIGEPIVVTPKSISDLLRELAEKIDSGEYEI